MTAAFVVLSTGMFHGRKYAREGMTNSDLSVRGASVAIAGLD
jgi:hypothetical protein